jgi:hypothetical protein
VRGQASSHPQFVYSSNTSPFASLPATANSGCEPIALPQAQKMTIALGLLKNWALRVKLWWFPLPVQWDRTTITYIKCSLTQWVPLPPVCLWEHHYWNSIDCFSRLWEVLIAHWFIVNFPCNCHGTLWFLVEKASSGHGVNRLHLLMVSILCVMFFWGSQHVLCVTFLKVLLTIGRTERLTVGLKNLYLHLRPEANFRGLSTIHHFCHWLSQLQTTDTQGGTAETKHTLYQSTGLKNIHLHLCLDLKWSDMMEQDFWAM